MDKRNFIMLAGAVALAACGQDGTSGDSAEGAGPYVPAHDIQQLMEHVVQPNSEIYWGSSGYIIDETGETDLTPTTEEGWRATRVSAATVTQMGNLLMTPLYAEGRGEDWITFSQGLVEVGKLAEQAAIARDSDRIFEVGGTLYNVCQACHLAYVPEEIAAQEAASGN